MDEVNEVIIRRKLDREPMSFDRLQFICYFAAGLVAEVLGFISLIVLILCMSGVLK